MSAAGIKFQSEVEQNALNQAKYDQVQFAVESTNWYSYLESELRNQFMGELILPRDYDAYHEARMRPFNMDQRGHPFLIARVRSTEDVAAIVRFVSRRAESTRLCVACGCHSSKCMMDDAIIIDLFHLSGAQVDLSQETVSVLGGSYLKVMDEALEKHGYAMPTGTYPETGVGGLTLAAGKGWLTRKWGMAVDNLIGAQVVLADGRVVEATDDNEHSDLLWGLRGGGGNFGIVTKFVFKIHKLDPSVLGGFVVHAVPTIDDGLALARNFDEHFQERLSTDVTGVMVFPAGAPVMPTAWAYFGEATSIDAVPALRESTQLSGDPARVVQNTLGPIPYHTGLQRMMTPFQTKGNLYQTLHCIGSYRERLPEQAFLRLMEHTRAPPHEYLDKAAVVMFTMGGEYSHDKNNSNTCVPVASREGRYFVIIEAYWKVEFGTAGKDIARNWAKTAFSILQPYQTELMLYASDEIKTNDVVKHSDGQLQSKLEQLKAKYDKSNFFRQNANIQPAKAVPLTEDSPLRPPSSTLEVVS